MHKRSSTFVYIKLGIMLIALCAVLFGFSHFSTDNADVKASASGPSASHTNAPGENNCTACHTSFPLNSGIGNLTISGLPPNYLPGQQVPVTVTVNDANAIVYGSQTTAIDGSGNAAGTFTPPATNPQTMQVIAGLVDGHQRSYIEHTVDGIIPTQAGTKSWTFTWTAPPRRVGKISFYTASNAANSDATTSGDYIYATSAATLSGSALSNFDNDGKSDVAVWRPASGNWYSINSSNSNPQVTQWGTEGDRPVPGDYDGDGKTDVAVFRPSDGNWYIIGSASGVQVVNWGIASDITIPGDYDGDGKTDLAVFRPSDGNHYILGTTGGVQVVNWGIASDVTVSGDYDGDGKTDVAVFRPSDGNWFVIESSDGVRVTNWGIQWDIPVPADYDGDGKSDIAAFRPSDGNWYIIGSSTGVQVTNWGIQGDIPVPADYDGDGKGDIAVFRPSDGNWYIIGSSTGVQVTNWGVQGDIPIPSAYVFH
jgi:hypothetical protein